MFFFANCSHCLQMCFQSLTRASLLTHLVLRTHSRYFVLLIGGGITGYCTHAHTNNTHSVGGAQLYHWSFLLHFVCAFHSARGSVWRRQKRKSPHALLHIYSHTFWHKHDQTLFLFLAVLAVCCIAATNVVGVVLLNCASS